jgi:serine/threonine protein kinase
MNKDFLMYTATNFNNGVKRDYNYYYKYILNERYVGLLGNECRFLVKLIASFENRCYIFHFMEFLNGGNLNYHCKKQSFNEYQVQFYAAQITCGILYLHSKQLVHGYKNFSFF